MDRKKNFFLRVFSFRFGSKFRVILCERKDFLLIEMEKNWHHAVKVIKHAVKWSLNLLGSARVFASVTKQLFFFLQTKSYFKGFY